MAKHEERESKGGRYAKGSVCDGCGKSAGLDYATDEEVCGSTDGPGFFVCARVRCPANAPEFQARSVEERRAHYAATRAKGAAPSRSRIVVRFDTTRFEFNHGHPPRGTGSWAFDVGTGPEFVPTSTFTEAKRAFTKILLDRLPRREGGGVEHVYVEVCS